MNATNFKQLTSYIELQHKRALRWTYHPNAEVRKQANYEASVLEDILKFAKRIEKTPNYHK